MMVRGTRLGLPSAALRGRVGSQGVVKGNRWESYAKVQPAR